MDENRFLNAEKAMLVAPAGFGKTHFISAAVKKLNSKQLILTHTHAGVASIRHKLSATKVAKELYHVETISSFAQRFTRAYYTGGDIPPLPAKEHFPFVIQKATDLFCRQLVARVVRQSYEGLFVDEYQDCTELQHRFILQLASLLPTRILGDHMQGIFDICGETTVNLQSEQQMAGFIDTVETLDGIPWRWRNTGREDLGDAVASIRQKLSDGLPVELAEYRGIEYVNCCEDELLDWRSPAGRKVKELSAETDVLFIHPRSESPHFRLELIKRYMRRFDMIEAIDDAMFYELSRKLDEADFTNFVEIVEKVLMQLVNRTKLKNWIAEGRIKNKLRPRLEGWEVQRYDKLLQAGEDYKLSPTTDKLKNFLVAASKLPGILCYRPEIYGSLLDAMALAFISGKTVEAAMVDNRNRLRRLGKRVRGRSIGTTLLTKGLEFGTVAILNAHQFTCPKHFYVAVSRASRRLVIFSNSQILNPYQPSH